MELTHSFTVPASVDQAWDTFVRVDSLATCFPGATVTEADGDTFTGNVKVKLGPIALVYSGTGSFLEKDRESGRLVAQANGKDKRGNGTAGATITAAITDAGDGSTKVDVTTDLQITGKPAQFGRGVIQDVSDKLLGQFVACLQARIGTDAAAEGATEPTDLRPAAEISSADPSGTVEPTPTESSTQAAQAAQPAQPAQTAQTAQTAPRVPTAATGAGTAAAGSEALDLGTAVVPIVLQSYRKQLIGAAVGVLGLILVRILIRRR